MGNLKIAEPDVRVLNAASQPGLSGGGAGQAAAVTVARDLQRLMLRMKGDVISEDGRGVQYDRLKDSSLFQQYLGQTASLHTLDLTTLTETEKKAFFINIYNALTIHGLVHSGPPPSSVLDVQLFWKKTAYNIGGMIFSLDDIEHGILRGNRPNPAATSPPIKTDDPRLKFVVHEFDPRIHFALVCGAKSCPAIQVYTPDNLNAALDSATRNFCEQEVSVHDVQREIHVSKILQWYRSDFGDNDVKAIRWTLPYLSEEKARKLKQVLNILETQGMVDLHYKDYNWNLNKV